MTDTQRWRQMAKLLEDAAGMLKCAADSIDRYEALLSDPRVAMPSELHFDCGLSVRARKALCLLGCRTPFDITKLTAENIRKQKNCGETTVLEIRMWLKQFGLAFSGEQP